MTQTPVKLLLLTLALTGAEASARRQQRHRDRRFHIKTVSGPVDMRFPFEAVWHPILQGQSIPAGVMLSVGEDARIGFDYPKPGALRESDRLLVNINAPIVARLGDDLIRKVKVTSQFLDRKAAGGAAPAGGLVSQLRETWEKYLAVTRNDGKGESAGIKKDMEARHNAGAIAILRPAPDSLVMAPTPTSGVHVVWRPVKGTRVEYGLKVWLADQAEPAVPTARTESSDYLVKPSRFGRYHASVASEDGEWQSPVITFDFASSSSTPLAAMGSGSRDETSPVDLALVSPPDNLIVQDAKAPYYFDFAWVDHGAAATTTYQVIVRDERDVVRASMKTLVPSAQVYLPAAGVYTWQVLAISAPGGPGSRRVKTSVRRSLSLESPGTPGHPATPLPRRLAQLLATPGKRVLQLESGL